MNATTIQLHTAFRIDDVDPRIFSGLLEHMGRAVYEGVFEPGEQEPSHRPTPSSPSR